jgi:NAD(P)H-dependent FMN reductase
MTVREIAGTPRVVLLAGSLSAHSSADRLARWCARRCVEEGMPSVVFSGNDLEFPFYRPGRTEPRSRAYLAALAGADGVVLLSPAYHGAPSGLLKNALDYVNELAGDPRPYLHGRAIGCVAVAGGDQGAHSTVASLRTIGHALRGWPTPLGVTLARERAAFADDGSPAHPSTVGDLTVMLEQVLTMARWAAREQADALL